MESTPTTLSQAVHGSPEQVAKLFAAIAKAQGAMGRVLKAEYNPHRRFRYAKYSQIRIPTLEPLSENGLAIMHTPCESPDPARFIALRTIIGHEEGAWIETRSASPILAFRDKEGNITDQSIGSAHTYLAKYHLLYTLCLLVDEEDDPDQRVGAPREEMSGQDRGRAQYRTAPATQPNNQSGRGSPWSKR